MKRGSPSSFQYDSDSASDVGSLYQDDLSAAPSPPKRVGSTNAAEPRPKRRRNRKHLSCEPCRARKVKCDRRSECSNCRLQGVVCRWHEAAPIAVSDSHTIQLLKEENTRLRQLVEMLMNPPSIESPPYIQPLHEHEGVSNTPEEQEHELLLPTSIVQDYSAPSSSSTTTTFETGVPFYNVDELQFDAMAVTSEYPFAFVPTEQWATGLPVTPLYSPGDEEDPALALALARQRYVDAFEWAARV